MSNIDNNTNKYIVDIKKFSHLTFSYLLEKSHYSSTKLNDLSTLIINDTKVNDTFDLDNCTTIEFQYNLANINHHDMIYLPFNNCVSTNIGSHYSNEILSQCLLTFYFYKTLNNYNESVLVSIESNTKIDYYILRIDYSSLKNSFNFLINLISPLINYNYTKNLKQNINLIFPYKSIRDGQYEFINETYKTIKHNEKLIINAPTGIGKSISSLFSAVRAKLNNYSDKIFYLTCKGTNYYILKETLTALQKTNPVFNWILIQAKETQCLNNFEKFSSIYCSRNCKYNTTIEGISYEEREINAIKELIINYHALEPKNIKLVAEKHCVCPYELSLDASEFCDIIICDYNYVFDPSIRLKRYFENSNNKLKYTFLIDEAHNLPDRIKNNFCEQIYSDELIKIYELLINNDINTTISDHLYDLISYLNTYNSKIDSNYYNVNGKETLYGYYISDAIDLKFLKLLKNIKKDFDSLLKINTAFVLSNLEYFRIKIIKSINILNVFSNKFKFFIEQTNDKITYYLMCINPSDLAAEALNFANSSILFSASIIPIEYYQNLLGLKKSKSLIIESPYPSNNLDIIAYTGISTRFIDRNNTIISISNIVNTIVSSKKGNYFVFFPSYDYLNMFYNSYKNSSVNLFIQKQNMTQNERKLFLNTFSNPNIDKINIGLCVLGGSFSEGIDLYGDKLIGSIIIGTGIPNINSILNLTQEYYQNYYEKGKEYTYIYPGFNKVLQAAGRVIRSDTDVGTIVLIDDRYGSEEYINLYPKHWRDIKYISNLERLKSELKSFWQKKQKK